MKKIVTLGEIMLRLAPAGRERLVQARSLNATFGGSEANVAVALAHWGLRAEFVTRLPENAVAEWCLSELRRWGVGLDEVVRGGERMGIYYVEPGAVARPTQVTYDRLDSAAAQLAPGMVDWERVLRGAEWFHFSGITPALSESAAGACAEAVDAAVRGGVKVSLDLNYRSKLWRWGRSAGEVMPALAERCDVLMGNEEDAARVFGIRAEGFDPERCAGEVDAAPFEQVCRRLQERFPRLSAVALTLRGSINADDNYWGGCLWHAGRLHLAPRYRITHIVDRMGAGDAFAAGIIRGLSLGHDAERTLSYAVAASCLKHTVYGDFALVSPAEVQALAQGAGAGRVVR